MLSKIRIKNFKCFQDTGELKIRPLTILVGPNSSGKSSILQMLLMLRQTIESTDTIYPLIQKGAWVDVGEYSDFIYKGELERNLEFHLEFFEYIPPKPPIEFKRRKPNKLRLNAIFNYDHNISQIRLINSNLSLLNEQLLSQKIYLNKTGDAYSVVHSSRKKKWRGKDAMLMKFYNFGIHYTSGEDIEKIKKAIPPRDLRFGLENILESEIRSLHYLGPLREIPKRVYSIHGEAPKDVGKSGERAIDILWSSYKDKTKVLAKITNEVRRWLRKFDIAADIRLSRLGKTHYYQVLIKDNMTGHEINFADTGFGVSQTLPIIIECFHASIDSIILIEQPEIHLHPKAQASLGDLFIQGIKQKYRSFIIETHSEHIISRICRRIAEGEEIKKEDVAIYYFEPTPKGTHIQEITIDDDGQFMSFPTGFFEEDIEEAFEHLKAIRTHSVKKKK